MTTQLDLLPDDSYSFHFDADLFVELPSLFVSLIFKISLDQLRMYLLIKI